jgi:two-component system chemotaxis response regulator CheB
MTTAEEERVTSVDPRRTAQAPSPARTLVAIIASAGGIGAIRTILRSLPQDLGAAVAVVQHRTTASPNLLVQVLQRATRLKVKLAQEGEPLLPSTVYVAPPDVHLTVFPDGTVRLVDGTRIHHVLSSASPLLESAPHAFGRNVVAVVLTGCSDDGSDAVKRVADAGGSVIAQDPATAEHARMPQSAIATGAVHDVLSVNEIGRRVVQLVDVRR